MAKQDKRKAQETDESRAVSQMTGWARGGGTSPVPRTLLHTLHHFLVLLGLRCLRDAVLAAAAARDLVAWRSSMVLTKRDVATVFDDGNVSLQFAKGLAGRRTGKSIGETTMPRQSGALRFTSSALGFQNRAIWVEIVLSQRGLRLGGSLMSFSNRNCPRDWMN